jgi:Putative transposase, YhgA-like
MPRRSRQPAGALTPHHQFLHALLARPAVAERLLRDHLPAELTDRIRPGSLTVASGSFIDGRLRSRHADLLLHASLITPGQPPVDLLLHVLWEFKSGADPFTRLQLLGYMANIWDAWDRKPRSVLSAGGPHPPVILPIIIHNGPRPWPHSRQFAALFPGAGAELAAHVPTFSHALIDLAALPDSALSSDPVLAAKLAVAKNIHRPDLEDLAGPLLLAVVVAGPLEVDDVLEYLMAKLGGGRVREAVSWVIAAEGGAPMGAFAEYMRAEAKAEGKAEGTARALLKVAERRFGPLSPGLRRKIEAADAATLDRWVDSILDAPDLETAFGTLHS